MDRFALTVGRLVPDAISAAVILMLIVVAAALAFDNAPAKIIDAYYQGLWMLLPFTMQMTLIIVLSAVLGSTSFFRRTVALLSRLPRSMSEVVALAVLVTAFLSYLYWGLGIALGPLVAIYFAREAERKGIELDFPFFLAVVWAANAVWQYGLSSSAALLVATPGHFLEGTIGVIPLSTTIWSPAAIIQEVAYVIVVIAAGIFFMPPRRRQLSEFPEASKLSEPIEAKESAGLTAAERLERSSVLPLVLSGFLVIWLDHHFRVKGQSLDINSLNAIFLLLCLILHRNFHRFTTALQAAVLSSWPVVVIYHLYAGVAGLIQYTTVGATLAGMVASVSGRYTLPLLTAAAGTLFAIFIPSSGGQWVIQGFVTVKAAEEVGMSVQRGLLALGVGDHMGNLISPFWYMIVAGVARIDFRTFFGYGLLFALLWFVLGVVVFTFAPC